MILQAYRPGLGVADYVRTYRIVQYSYASNKALPAKAYPPRPEHCLSFYARDVESVSYQRSGVQTGGLPMVLFGMQTEVSNRFVGNNFLLIQVVFKPGGLFRLTGIPATQFTNQYMDAQAVFAPDIRTINEQINHCNTHAEMIQVVESFLIKTINHTSIGAHPADMATAAIFNQSDVPGVDALAKAACQSTRQFERHFKERMGVSPKYYLKVMQFEKAFRLKNTHPATDWLSIAVTCGYHDYQHLSKAYVDLTGLTPNQFHALDANAPERVFGATDTF